MLLACHCRATLRAAATGLGTALHLAVVAHASTGLGALAADLRARTAGGRVNCSAAQHGVGAGSADRSEEHTSELQSLMRSSYAVFCLKRTNGQTKTHNRHT